MSHLSSEKVSEADIARARIQWRAEGGTFRNSHSLVRLDEWNTLDSEREELLARLTAAAAEIERLRDSLKAMLVNASWESDAAPYHVVMARNALSGRGP